MLKNKNKLLLVCNIVVLIYIIVLILHPLNLSISNDNSSILSIMVATNLIPFHIFSMAVGLICGIVAFIKKSSMCLFMSIVFYGIGFILLPANYIIVIPVLIISCISFILEK